MSMQTGLWAIKCAELLPSSAGVFEPSSPLLQYLVEPFTEGTGLSVEPESIKASFSVDALHTFPGAGPLAAKPNLTMSFLFVPEHQIGHWVFGRNLRLHSGRDIDCNDDDVTDRARGKSMDARPLHLTDATPFHGPEATVFVARFVLNLQTGRLYTVMPGKDGRIQILVVVISRRGSLETDSLVFHGNSKLEMRCISFSQCEFCDARSVDCLCPRSWRRRTDRFDDLALRHWVDLMAYGQTHEDYMSQTTQQLFIAQGDRMIRLSIIQRLQYKFRESEPLQWLRETFARMMEPTDKMLLSDCLTPSHQDDVALRARNDPAEYPDTEDDWDSFLSKLCESEERLSMPLVNEETRPELVESPKPTSSESLSCDKCSAVFKSSFNRSRHVAEVHGRLRNFRCERCARSFTQRANLVRHIRTVHMKFKPFQCSNCPLAFTTRANLMRHCGNKHAKS